MGMNKILKLFFLNTHTLGMGTAKVSKNKACRCRYKNCKKREESILNVAISFPVHELRRVKIMGKLIEGHGVFSGAPRILGRKGGPPMLSMQ